MRAEIKRFHSPDTDDLENFEPQNPDRFVLLIQVMIGPAGVDGEESFDVIVCTPDWLADRAAETGFVCGRHHFIVNRYDFRLLRERVAQVVAGCRANPCRPTAIVTHSIQ